MAAKQSFNIETLLECPICLSECDDPRVLPCLHSLCRKCLQEHMKVSAEGNNFKCPSCRHECEVPPGGVTALPKNFLFNSLKEMLQQQSEHKSAVTSPFESKVGVTEKQCSLLNKGNLQHTRVTAFCLDCAEFFCSNCEGFHKVLGVTSEHQLRPATEVNVSDVLAAQSRRKRPKCDRHPAMSMDIYCATCHMPVCASCYLLTHQNHTHRDLLDVGKESKSTLAGLALTADKLVSNLDQHLTKLDALQRYIEKDSKEACQQIRQTADELRALITNREQSLIKEIQDSEKTALTEVRAAHKETELNKASVQSLHSYIHTLQVTGDVADQVVHTPGLQEQLRQQEAPRLLSVTWTVDLKRETQNEATLQNMIGTVSVNVKQTVATSDAIPDDMKEALASPVLSLKPDVANYISGLAVIGDCVCVTGWCRPYFWIHNMKTNTNKKRKLDGLKAVGMTSVHGTVHNNNTLVITDSNKRLHFITISPDNMDITKHTVKDIPFVPLQVSVDLATGKLIIANKTDKQITICDNTGNIENRVTVNTSITYMRCALATDDGYIVLDCTNQGRVHWVNKEGTVTHTYGQRDGEGLKYPPHMIPDSQGRLVVADTDNHILHLIDVNRQLSHYLLTENDGIEYPRRVHLDETTERLFVGHNDIHNARTVSVYKWPFTSTPCTHHTINLQLNRYK